MPRKYKFKGGPYDGQEREVAYDLTGGHQLSVQLPHPADTKLVTELSWGVGDETPPASTVDIRTVTYYLTKVRDMYGLRYEYWTQEAREADLRKQQTTAQRLAQLEADFQRLLTENQQLADGITALSTALAKVEQRLEGVLTVNELWDGS